MAKRLTKAEALNVVIEAAENWLNELSEYIIPASEEYDDGCDYQTGYDRIEEAIKVLSKEKQ